MKQTTKQTMTVNEAVQEYIQLRKQESFIKERKSYLADIIKADAEKNGVKTDNGSFYTSNDVAEWGKQAKTSVKLNEERALKLIKERGLVNCIKVTELVDEDSLEEAIKCGEVTMDEFESITDRKVTYSVSVTEKAELAEVQESTVQMVAQKKKKRKRG
jgi:hypothetical protein